jgi:hypothetical protein
MLYDKVGRVTYLFCLNVVDVVSRYKASVPIGTYSVKDREGILTSKTIARAIEKIYDDPECPLTWPETFLSDHWSKNDLSYIYPTYILHISDTDMCRICVGYM